MKSGAGSKVEETSGTGAARGTKNVVTFEVRGIGLGLLQHNPGGMSQRQGAMGAKRIPEPEVEAAAGVYRDADGFIAMRASAFRSAILSACKNFKIGKDTAIARMAPGVLEVGDEFCRLLHPATKEPLTKWEVDIRRAVVQRQAVLRARPLFREWLTYVTFEIDVDFVTEEQVLDRFCAAGKAKGVGDYRIEKRGRFGQFEVKIAR